MILITRIKRKLSFLQRQKVYTHNNSLSKFIFYQILLLIIFDLILLNSIQAASNNTFVVNNNNHNNRVLFDDHYNVRSNNSILVDYTATSRGALINNNNKTQQDRIQLKNRRQEDFHTQDRVASDSILRPQLALQIFTNSPINDNNNDDDSSHNKIQSTTTKLPNGGSTMLILPLQSQDSNNHQSTIKSFLMPTETNSVDETIAINNNNNKLGPWHYITESQSNLIEPTQSLNSKRSYRNSATTNPSPLINAIISVPSPSEHHYHHHHSQQQQASTNNNQAESFSNFNQKENNGSLTLGNIEFSMNLNGDEIIINPSSSSVNGYKNQKINNNSVSNRNDNIVMKRFKMNRSVDSGQKADFSDDKRIVSKALRKHVEHSTMNETDDGDDEQSASEIDLVDKSNRSDSDSDADLPDSISISDGQTIDNNENDVVKIKLKDIINDDKNEKITREDHSNDSQSVRNDNDQETQLHEESRLSNNHRSIPSNYQERDDRLNSENDINRYNSIRREQPSVPNKRSSSKNHSFKKTFLSNGSNNYNQQQQHRNTSGSKRKTTTHKSEDTNENVDSNDNNLSSVLIKGEDVKKFEQLLENLRSLSLGNLNTAKSKRINKLANKPKQFVGHSASLENQNNNNNNDDDDSDPSLTTTTTTTNIDYQNNPKQMWNNNDGESGNGFDNTSNNVSDNRRSSNRNGNSELSSNSGRLTQIESTHDTNDCNKRSRSNHITNNKSLNSESSIDNFGGSDSNSPNIVDHDPMTSNDGNDDLNDESAQNNDQEESSGSDNHNKVVSASESLSSEQQARKQLSRSDSDGFNNDNSNQAKDGASNQGTQQPRSLLVRKTILQDYYDNNFKPSTGRGSQLKGDGDDNDDNELETVHNRQHESQHEKDTSSSISNQAALVQQIFELTGGQLLEQQRRLVPLRPNTATINYINDDLSPINNYIDYNKLDDREIYRGSESQKYKVTVPSRHQLEHMRSLQQAIERSAMENEKAN